VPDGTIAPGTTVNLAGPDGVGLLATVEIGIRPSTVTVDNFTVNGVGGAFGLAAETGSSIPATNSTLVLGDPTDSGAALYLSSLNDYGFFDGGTINFIDSTATSIAPNIAGVFAQYGIGTGTPNVLNISGSSVISGSQAVGMDAESTNLNATITKNSVVTGSNGTLIQVRDGGSGPSVVNLEEDSSSIMTGAALTEAGSTLNMTPPPG